MSNNYFITPRAEQDIHKAWLYTIEVWGESQADKYVRDLFERIEWLAENPCLGRERSDISNGYFSFGEGGHLIFYKITQAGIVVIGIPHQAMDLPEYY